MNEELIAKAKTAKSAQELIEMAKAENIELTDEKAQEYFARLNAASEISDDELEAVSGGCGYIDGKQCPNCGSTNTKVSDDRGSFAIYKCENCQITFQVQDD